MVFLHAMAFFGNIYTTTSQVVEEGEELVVFLHAIAFLGNIYYATKPGG